MTNIHPSADVATTEKFVFNGIHFRLSTTEEIATPRLKSCRGAALALAYKYGWHVFPVPPGTKKSYKAAKYSGGQNWGMTSDPDRICRDFTRWPTQALASQQARST